MFGMGSAANAMPPLQPFRSLRMRMYEVGPSGGPAAVYAINAASSLRLAEHLHSSFKKFIHLDVPRLKDVWLERFLNLWGTEVVQLLEEMCPSTLLFLNFSGGREGKHKDPSYSTTPARNPTSRRQWTNIILALNIMIYVAQLASQGKLILWGAKVNSLINEGQIWRLITSSFLHANAVHLMVNCFSLNSIGPAVEGVSGPRRFLAVYFTSALTSSAVSYWFSKAPAVGASGAIFGLVGSVAVFTLRHRGLIGGAKEDLKHIAKVIILNMAIGLMSRDIDNWGHLGGLLGGIVTSWIIGPAWKYESTTIDGRKIFSDRAPIFHIIKRNR